MNFYVAPALAALSLVGFVVIKANNTLDRAGTRGQATLEPMALVLLGAFGALLLAIGFYKTPRWVTITMALATLGVGAIAYMVGTARVD